MTLRTGESGTFDKSHLPSTQGQSPSTARSATRSSSVDPAQRIDFVEVDPQQLPAGVA
jgi:hypothetical protein